MSDDTRTRRAAESPRQTNTTMRHIFEGVAVAILVGVLVGFVTLRDDVIFSTTWSRIAAPEFHREIDGRLKHLERPEALIQLAQATDALRKVEAAADLAKENAAAIGVIQNDLEHIKGSGTRRERMLEAMLAKIDKLGVIQSGQ